MEINKYDNNTFIGQPKLNGSNCLVFTNGSEVHIMNRHKDELNNVHINTQAFKSLHRGNGWIVLNGEYMNKSKKNGSDLIFNHKFIIFDILVYNNRQLVGKTFKERVDLLNDLYNSISYDNYIRNISEDIYIVETFYDGFESLYERLTPTDMYEGLVLKKSKAKLKNGISKSNNTSSQIKVRKATKNYDF
jgi:ATP-dependent DNA ligase